MMKLAEHPEKAVSVAKKIIIRMPYLLMEPVASRKTFYVIRKIRILTPRPN